MRACVRVALTAVALSAGFALAGCDSVDRFVDTMQGLMDTKKKLPGDRKAVFPEGVPGVVQGVPPEYLPKPKDETAEPVDPARTAEPVKPEQTAKPKPTRTAKPSPPPETSEPAVTEEEPEAQTERTERTEKPAKPAAKPRPPQTATAPKKPAPPPPAEPLNPVQSQAAAPRAAAPPAAPSPGQSLPWPAR